MSFLKKVINNKIYTIIFSFCLILMLISIISETNIFYKAKEFMFNSDYRNNYAENSDIPINFEINLLNIIIFDLTHFNWTYDYMLIWGTNIFQLILPIFAAISALIFYNKNLSINKFVLNKEKKYKLFLLKESLSVSFKMACSLFFAFIVFFVLSIIISKGEINSNISRSFLLDIIGNDFYTKYTQIYYLLDGIIRFFLAPLIYCTFACSISLLYQNYKQVFLSPIIYYYGLTLIAFSIRNISEVAIYFSPLLIMVPNAYSNINSYCVLIIPLIAIFASLGMVFWRGKYVEI